MQQSMHLSHYSKHLLPRPTAYILNQDQADEQIEILLGQLSQYNCIHQLCEFQKCQRLLSKMLKQLQKLDTRHRSYFKVKSLVLGVCCLFQMEMGHKIQPKTSNNNVQSMQSRKMKIQQSYKRIAGIIEQDQSVVKDISLPQFSAKVQLIKILYLMQLSKIQQQQNQSIQHNPEQPSLLSQERNINGNSIVVRKNPYSRQIQQIYRKFSRTKFLPQESYLDNRLWENQRLLEVLVYQYILILRKLADYDQVKASFLYKRGLELTKRMLGPEHRFVEMMKRIRKIRRDTNKLLKLDNNKQSKSQMVQSTRTTFKSNSLKKNKNLLKNNSQAQKRIYTQQAEVEQQNMKKSKSLLTKLEARKNKILFSTYQNGFIKNSSSGKGSSLWIVSKYQKGKITELSKQQSSSTQTKLNQLETKNIYYNKQKIKNFKLDDVNQAVSKIQDQKQEDNDKSAIKNIFNRRTKKQDHLQRNKNKMNIIKGGRIISQESTIKQMEEKMQKLLDIKMGDHNNERANNKRSSLQIQQKQGEGTQNRRIYSRTQKLPENPHKNQQLQQHKRYRKDENAGKKQKGRDDNQSDWSCQII